VRSVPVGGGARFVPWVGTRGGGARPAVEDERRPRPRRAILDLPLDICDWLINNVCVSTSEAKRSGEERTTGRRSTAEARREAVIDAATTEFAEHGYHAASTAAIAKRAGISQPYIYALFSDKETLFLACHRRVCEHIREAFAEAAKGTEPGDERISAMGAAYYELLQGRRELLLQLQAFAAAGEPKLRAEIRRGFVDVLEDVRRLCGERDEAGRFVATGMFLNVLTALDVPDDYWPAPLAEGRDA
jgi:AcrR family transcriptional regulator